MQAYFCLTVLTVLLLVVHRAFTDPDGAANGLESTTGDGSDVPGSIPVGSNDSVASSDSVRVVVPSSKHEAVGESSEDPLPNEKAPSEAEDDRKPVVKKAPKPIGTAESVGYVPIPEEKKKEEKKPAVEQDRTVRMIPSLPPK